MSRLITRDQWAAYMNIGSHSAPIWAPMAEGFTRFSESVNPMEYSYQHFDRPEEYTDVIGFSPAYSYTVDAIADDPIVAELIHITDSKLTGADARREILLVNRWQSIAPGIFRAFLRTVSVIPATSGQEVGIMVYSGTMKCAGRAIPGAFDVGQHEFFTEVETQ